MIRIAKRKDLKALLEIYNIEVEEGVATLDINRKTMNEWENWFNCHNIKNHPLIVEELDGHVVGYACFSKYREKEAYRTTVELSIYVNRQNRGYGIGDRLMKRMIEIGKKTPDIHTIISVVTSKNAVSRNLHKKYGFVYCGTIKEAGRKFNKYLDIDFFQLLLK